MQTHDLEVCVDCVHTIAHGYVDDITDEREREVAEGLDALSQEGWLCNGDAERDEEFSWRSCDCCGTTDGGSRHHVVLMVADEDAA